MEIGMWVLLDGWLYGFVEASCLCVSRWEGVYV